MELINFTNIDLYFVYIYITFFKTNRDLLHALKNIVNFGKINLMNKKVSGGVVHKTPKDIKQVLISNSQLKTMWEDVTPLARNEWLCWIENAKKEETRIRRIKIMSENLTKGQRRPCCWAGCIHR